MKVYVVIKDETNYNGDRAVFGVYTSKDKADSVAAYEIEKAKDWCNSMKESDGGDYHWIPDMIVVESDLSD